jgi:PilZ domain
MSMPAQSPRLPRLERVGLISPALAEQAQIIAQRSATDRRLHRRVEIALLGRFMRANRQEYPCKLKDMSVGGAGIMSPVDVELEERIVVYFDELGGLEGAVARVFPGGFGMRLASTQHKREKIASQLTFLVNRPFLGEFAERRHERIAPTNTPQSLTLADGIILSCHLLDISLSGASIATPARPALGTDVKLGKLSGKVMRHHGEGIGIQFTDVQHPNALRRIFG